MKQVLVFAGSNSKESINKKLAIYASTFIKHLKIKTLDLNDFELPIYSEQHQNDFGIPEKAIVFYNTIKQSEGIILSLAEHNGAYTAAFKNLFDWISVKDGKFWSDIPMLLMATSPGSRGGKSVLDIAKSRFPYMGGNIIDSFSLPSFGDNFKENKIIDSNLNDDLKLKVIALESFIIK